MKGGSAPQAPDPYKVAAAQGVEDRRTLQYGLNNSRTATVNPFGSTTWKNNKTFDQSGFDAAMAAYRPAVAASGGQPYRGSGTGMDADFGAPTQPGTPEVPGTPASGTMPNRADFEGVDQWTNTQTLSPESQGIYDQATGKLGQAVGNIDTSGAAYNDKIADALFARMRQYQDPLDAQARSAMQSNLADRGFQVGNEGFNNEMTRLDDSQNRARTDGANAAVIGGGTEARAQQAMQQQIAQSLSSLRNQQVAGVAGMPTTTTTPSIQAPDLAGNIYKGYENQMNQYNAQQAGNNSMFGNLLNLGGMAMGVPGLGGLAGMFGGGGGGSSNGGNTSRDFFTPRGR